VASAHPDRARSLLVLAAALVGAYLLLVHWWFTAPMLDMGSERDALRDKELELRLEAAQAKDVAAKLDQVRRFQAGHPSFLPEANKELASAALVQRLEQVVGSASPNPAQCQITARTPSDIAQNEEFEKVVVQVRLRCGMTEMAEVLRALEGGSPQMFVDNLELLSRRSYLGVGAENNAGAMDVSFDLYGYLPNKPGAASRG
jgi:general secretion pathway protein M